MKRFAHFIKENKSVRIPKKIVYFDTETTQIPKGNDKIIQKFKLGVACFQRIKDINKPPVLDWIETLNAPQLCEWIISKACKRERLYIISANIWFDLRVSNMLVYLKQKGWCNPRMFTTGMTLIISFKKDDRTIIFVNFQNYFRTSVHVMGDCLGVPKLKIDFDKASTKALMIYCRRDTEILYRSMNALFKFIKDKQLGNFGYTFPSTAFNIYRHTFMKSKLLVHNNKIVTELERASYFGGRVECFKLGYFSNVNLVQVDINSMYPYIMRNRPSPTILKYYTEQMSLACLEEYLNCYCVAAHCTIETDEPVYPVRVKGKCVFPVGRFNTYLSTGSLEYALEHGHIKKVMETAIFLQDYIFTEYVDFFYNLRLKYAAAGNIPFSLMCKLLLNSLYGKFGQRGDRVVSTNECNYLDMSRHNYYDAEDKKHYIVTKFFGKEVVSEKSVQEGMNSIVSIAAHVTDYSRMYLWKFLNEIGLSNCYYCDTDCIIFDQDKYDVNKIHIDATKLGAFKIETQAMEINLKGLKDYEFGGKVKIKGVGKRAEKINDHTYRQLFFPGIYTELHEGIDNLYETTYKTKKLKRNYTKGTVLQSGDVVPLKLNI